jgi:hypothetical protein
MPGQKSIYETFLVGPERKGGPGFQREFSFLEKLTGGRGGGGDGLLTLLSEVGGIRLTRNLAPLRFPGFPQRKEKIEKKQMSSFHFPL